MAGGQYIVAVVHAFVLIAQKSGFHTLLANSHIIKLSNSNLQCRLEIFRENMHNTLQLVFFS